MQFYVIFSQAYVILCTSDSFVWVVHADMVILSMDTGSSKFYNHILIIWKWKAFSNAHTHTHTCAGVHTHIAIHSAPFSSSITSLHLLLSGVSKASLPVFLMDAFQTEFLHTLAARGSCWCVRNNVESCGAHLSFQPSLRLQYHRNENQFIFLIDCFNADIIGKKRFYKSTEI